MNDLEVIFPETSQWHDRIYYDRKEGKYYDRYSDIYITVEEFQTYCGVYNAN